MAISTIHTALMKGSGTSTVTYSKLVCITEFPGMKNPPESIETTTMCNKSRTYIPGVQSNDALEFKAFYTPTDFAALEALAGVDTPYALWFGAGSNDEPDGHNGKFSFKGDLRVSLDGAGVNDAVTMTITIYPSTDVTFAAS